MEVAEWSLSTWVFYNRNQCSLEFLLGQGKLSEMYVCASFSEAHTSAKFQRALDRNRRLQRHPGKKMGGWVGQWTWREWPQVSCGHCKIDLKTWCSYCRFLLFMNFEGVVRTYLVPFGLLGIVLLWLCVTHGMGSINDASKGKPFLTRTTLLYQVMALLFSSNCLFVFTKAMLRHHVRHWQGVLLLRQETRKQQAVFSSSCTCLSPGVGLRGGSLYHRRDRFINSSSKILE